MGALHVPLRSLRPGCRGFRLTEAIRAAFATGSVPIPKDALSKGPEPFWFFHHQQKAVAQSILQCSEGPAGWQAETISCHAFREQLDKRKEELPSVEAARNALQEAEAKSDLGGRALGSLMEVQNHLLALLAYLEGKEEFSPFAGERKPAPRAEAWKAWAEKQPWGKVLADQTQTNRVAREGPCAHGLSR